MIDDEPTTNEPYGVEDGSICCYCGKPIVFYKDPVHGAYTGRRARHYDCHTERHPKTEDIMSEFDRLHKKATSSLDELRKAVKQRATRNPFDD